MIWRDKDGCVWRRHPLVPGEWQILIEETQAWSDADLSSDDGPFTGDCQIEACRICSEVRYTYDDLLAGYCGLKT